MKSSLFPSLPEIVFAEKDPDAITQEVMTAYELITGRELSRADPVRLFLNAIILVLIQMRNAIDAACKMNLLAYAEGGHLDHIGALLGVRRLESSKASCMMSFTLSEPQAFSVTIPAGTRITGDGKIYFQLSREIEIPQGEITGSGIAVCTESGTQGNGYSVGELSRIVDPSAYEMGAVNITESTGGTDEESDEAYRERIHIAPESFTNAGSREGYRYYALSADSDIQDVQVIGPPESLPGEVKIYVLMKGGRLPTEGELAEVESACSADDVRPDTDKVNVLAPEVRECRCEAEYWTAEKDSALAESLCQAIEKAAGDWAVWQGNALGRDINPSRLVHDMISAGATRVEVSSPEYQAVGRHEKVSVVSVKCTYKGTE